jgi:hypothetical protein
MNDKYQLDLEMKRVGCSFIIPSIALEMLEHSSQFSFSYNEIMMQQTPLDWFAYESVHKGLM